MTSRTPNHRFPAPEEVRRHGHDESQSALPLGLVLGLPVRPVRPQPGKDKGSHASAAPRLRCPGHSQTGQGWARSGSGVGGISDSILQCAPSCRKCHGVPGPGDHHARGPQEELAVVKAGSSSSSVKFPGSVSLLSPFSTSRSFLPRHLCGRTPAACPLLIYEAAS